MNSDGTGFGLMHSFLAGGADGETPPGSLTLSGTKLYGMTESGTGSYTGGEIFSINPDGSGYRILHAFSGNDGGVPTGSLLIVGSMMYGTTSASGAGANGTVFAMKTDGTQFTVLHAFSSSSTDGSTPRGDLVLQGSTLYGTTRYGGSSGDGTVFSVNTDATGFTVLHSFAGGSNDGTYPWGGLTLSGSTLYGMSQGGGTYGDGTVFALTVPEPGTLVLLGLAAAGWLAYRRAKRGTGCSRR